MKRIFFSCDNGRCHDPDLTFRLDLDSVKLNEHAKYLCQRWFRQMHTLDGCLTWTNNGPVKVKSECLEKSKIIEIWLPFLYK